MVTSTDLMRALAALSGAGEFGSQVEIQVPDHPEMVAEVFGEIRDSGQDIESVLGSPERRSCHRTLLVRLDATDPQVVVGSPGASRICRNPSHSARPTAGWVEVAGLLRFL